MLFAVAVTCHACGESLEDDARFCGMCGAVLADANFGRVIAGRYLLKQRIAAGSLGVLYRAEQRGTRRQVAIKLLPDTALRDPQTIERFHREGQVLCSLRSQHSITTYEFDREPDGTLYIAMELSPGRSLARVLRDDGPLEWPRVLRILLGLCDSLGEAHAMGVIHRDLKPENILVEERPANRQFVKVSDFGLARVLSANLRISPIGQAVGSVEFSAPEQLLDRPIDARADLYGMGVLAFLLITGMHPFHAARTFGDMVAAHVQVPAPALSSLRPDVSPDVDALVSRLLEKDPARRYPDATALAAQIQLILSGAPPEPGATIPTLEGEEDTFLAEIPKPRS